MRVLFLDIDGVMNSLASATRLGTYSAFAPESVEALNYILAETGADVVISSTWRITRSIGDLSAVLWAQGVRCRPVIDKTPRYFDERDAVISPRGTILYRSADRGFEIAAWLETRDDIDSYVVLDDDSDAGVGHDGRFVQTEFEVGLTMDDARRAVEILMS